MSRLSGPRLRGELEFSVSRVCADESGNNEESAESRRFGDVGRITGKDEDEDKVKEGPELTTSGFFGVTGFLEGKSSQEIEAKWREVSLRFPLSVSVSSHVPSRKLGS